ncbi:MAG: U32 family peptidase [Candidatus Eremiobacteraeota bacterium]|nr:U32 family peptidase [Candidatus Eremiobacteraeota bacterium]
MEITTRIFTKQRLDEVSIYPYDAIYLGDPFAPDYPGNLCFAHEDLEETAGILKNAGKRVYVSTFSVPRNKDLAAIERQLKFIGDRSLPIDAIEAHNTGVLSMIREILPGIPVHMGCLSNIYTDSTVNLLKEYGVTRVSPNHELSLDELEIVKDRCGVEVEILVHGRMILGVSEECPAIWWNVEADSKENEEKPSQCTNIIDLESERMNLTVRGRITMSGKDVCMMEHMPLLAEKGFGYFRIDDFVSEADYFNTAGKLYRQALELIKAPGPDKEEYDVKTREYMDILSRFNSNGFCNGYYFKTSGSEYVKEVNA